MTVPHSSRFAGLKDYISHRETRLSLPSRWAFPPGEDGNSPGRSTIHSLSKWAGQKIRRGTTDATTIEEVHLFPGWATKRPRGPTSPSDSDSAFDVMLHVSGFATSRRSPEFLSRSQRAFLKLARSFASIPKLQPMPPPPDPDQPGCIEGLRPPSHPIEIPDEQDFENLDAQFRNGGNYIQEMDDPFTPQLTHVEPIPAELERLHENLESRLKLFWASSLSLRRVQVSVFLGSHDPKHFRHSLELRPLLTREMITNSDGHFSSTFKIDWQDICKHPIGTHITLNHRQVEHELLVQARIINAERTPELHETPTSVIQMPITHSIIRVISDIDDTVRVSKVLDGARAIFHQVFVKDLEDSLIPEMGAWYDTLWKCGVRFHYVSNSPFELLPLINQLISISKLPPGSIRLRSYAGRSLFNGLLSAPATRKKANVVEVLDHFPESQFFLVGDSGEQDLELYASLAAERPGQILGVFIRDVSALGLEGPTGTAVEPGLTGFPVKQRSRTIAFTSNLPPRTPPKRASSDTEICAQAHPSAIRIPQSNSQGSILPTSFSFGSPDQRTLSRVSEDSSSSIASTSSSSSSSTRSTTRPARHITEGEKKRWDLQSRVNKARLLMPSHIVLRVFEDPKECVEAEQIVRRLMDVS